MVSYREVSFLRPPPNSIVEDLEIHFSIVGSFKRLEIKYLQVLQDSFLFRSSS